MDAASEPQKSWSDSLLDSMRQVQDPDADVVIAELFASGQVNSVNRLMKALVENADAASADLPPSVKEYLTSSAALPSWADFDKIAMGERLFWQYGPAVIAILHCYSLPYCYSLRKGV